MALLPSKQLYSLAENQGINKLIVRDQNINSDEKDTYEIKSINDLRKRMAFEWSGVEYELQNNNRRSFPHFLQKWVDLSIVYQDVEMFLALAILDKARGIILSFPVYREKTDIEIVDGVFSTFREITKTIYHGKSSSEDLKQLAQEIVSLNKSTIALGDKFFVTEGGENTET
jgi:hypothetical protein